MKSTNKVVLNAIAANSRVACNSATIVIKPSPSADTQKLVRDAVRVCEGGE